MTSCSVVSLLPLARWQRGQPAPRFPSPFTDQPPIPAAPLLTERRERQWECKCLLNELLGSDTRPLEFGAFKQPSSSSFSSSSPLLAHGPALLPLLWMELHGLLPLSEAPVSPGAVAERAAALVAVR